MHFGISSDGALEVDVVTLFDIVRIQGLAHLQGHHRLILHVQPPVVLQGAERDGRVHRPAGQVLAVVVDAWHETQDTEALIIFQRVLPIKTCLNFSYDRENDGCFGAERV